MRRISRSASSNMARVVSPSGMPKPLNSVDDEPRPVPNSKRPSLRWSSMATRSATRAGWLTGGVRFQIAEPTWMRLVRAAMKGSTTSEAERCEYSSRKWCSTDHTYLKPLAVRGLGQLDLAQQARVLGAAGIGLDLLARDVRLDEEAELHPAAPS